MPNALDLITLHNTAAYVQSRPTPLFLGDALFPSEKVVGLQVQWVMGYNDVPVLLKPSALGSRAFTRDRIGAKEIKMDLPFFREQMLLDERVRQQLQRLDADLEDPYVTETIMRVFDDVNTLRVGAKAQVERMRMQLLSSGTISVTGANKDGRDVAITYDYDQSGIWKKKNVRTLTGTQKWDTPETSTPITDILDTVRVASTEGVTLRRAIISPKTFQKMAASEQVKALFIVVGTSIVVPHSDAEVIDAVQAKTGVRFTVYSDMYRDEDGKYHAYYPDDVVSFFPDGTLGTTTYGTTPEEADLIATQNTTVSVVDTGVAITQTREYGPPLVIKTIVSQLVLPRFPMMSSLYLLKV